MQLPDGQAPFEWVEVSFKNGRKEFFLNQTGGALHVGDAVAVEASPGHDIGTVALSGELVKLQMRKKGFKTNDEGAKKVYRKASQRDIDRWQEAQAREFDTMHKSRIIAKRLGLDMKISDVEYQGDGSKAIFYYTADARVDFRLLIKELAAQFGARIEMKQIGARQEAARLGGIGSCGRELCCSTWLTDFRTVNTSAARYQQLSLNPQKLAGQCGKLKCCLNYELDSYLEAVREFPEIGSRLFTDKGPAVSIKQDIFKGTIWYSLEEQPGGWIPISVKRANEIIRLNREKINPPLIDENEEFTDTELAPEYENAVGQDSLTRFDNRNRGNNNNRRKKRNKPRGNAQNKGNQ
jgi:cell fate regulator YaaT (PSP1 superfamily)